MVAVTAAATARRQLSICDLKSGGFPTKAALDCDVIVMLGVLERIDDVENLFTHLRFCRHDIILSYHASDLTTDVDRAARGFVNHLSFYELARLFDHYGFRIECTTPVDETQVLMRLTPSEWLSAPAACRVAVISADDVGDFGARLGCHIINSLLPGEAEAHHLNLHTLGRRAATTIWWSSGSATAFFRRCLAKKFSRSFRAPRRRSEFSARSSRELISAPGSSIDSSIGSIPGSRVTKTTC